MIDSLWVHHANLVMHLVLVWLGRCLCDEREWHHLESSAWQRTGIRLRFSLLTALQVGAATTSLYIFPVLPRVTGTGESHQPPRQRTAKQPSGQQFTHPWSRLPEHGTLPISMVGWQPFSMVALPGGRAFMDDLEWCPASVTSGRSWLRILQETLWWELRVY